MMEDLETNNARDNFARDVEIEEEILSYRLAVVGTHQHGHFQECAREPDKILQRTGHVITFESRPDPFSECLNRCLELAYFQGDGGVGAPPFFFHGDGGVGAPPFFFQGDGGVGAPPFAMTVTPLPLPATTVFRPIAPTRTSIAATTVIFFDIVPPRNTTFPEVMYLFRHQCQEVL
jgi:hypothetical protein